MLWHVFFCWKGGYLWTKNTKEKVMILFLNMMERLSSFILMKSREKTFKGRKTYEKGKTVT